MATTHARQVMARTGRADCCRTGSEEDIITLPIPSRTAVSARVAERLAAKCNCSNAARNLEKDDRVHRFDAEAEHVSRRFACQHVGALLVDACSNLQLRGASSALKKRRRGSAPLQAACLA